MKWSAANPMYHVRAFLLQESLDSLAHLSSYAYRPQSVADIRRPLKVPAKSLRSSISMMERQLGRSKDLAIHSTFQRAPGLPKLHMALVDLAVSQDHRGVKEVADLIQAVGCREVLVVHSGRSGHLYGLGGLTDERWLFLMTSLLGLARRSKDGTFVSPQSVQQFLWRVLELRDSPIDIGKYSSEFVDATFALTSSPAAMPGAGWLVETQPSLAKALAIAAYALLLNSPQPDEIVDTRWIAHRFLAGYGALRVTARQSQYLCEPTVVETIRPRASLTA